MGGAATSNCTRPSIKLIGQVHDHGLLSNQTPAELAIVQVCNVYTAVQLICVYGRDPAESQHPHPLDQLQFQSRFRGCSVNDATSSFLIGPWIHYGLQLSVLLDMHGLFLYHVFPVPAHPTILCCDLYFLHGSDLLQISPLP